MLLFEFDLPGSLTVFLFQFNNPRVVPFGFGIVEINFGLPRTWVVRQAMYFGLFLGMLVGLVLFAIYNNILLSGVGGIPVSTDGTPVHRFSIPGSFVWLTGTRWSGPPFRATGLRRRLFRFANPLVVFVFIVVFPFLTTVGILWTILLKVRTSADEAGSFGTGLGGLVGFPIGSPLMDQCVG